MEENKENAQQKNTVSGPIAAMAQTPAISASAAQARVIQPQIEQNPPATAAVSTPAPTPEVASAAEAKPKKVMVYRQKLHAKDSTSKHSPIGPRNCTILERDNPGLDKTPFKKGKAEPGKLKITLFDTKKNIHKRFFTQKDSMDWDDAKMISEANKWRNQILRRMLKRDPTFKGRTIRAKWGMREASSLKVEIKKKVVEAGSRKLTGAEWDEVVQAHNERYKGKTVFKGERLVGGSLAKTEETIAERTVIAIKALFDRNAELKKFMNDLVGETAEDDDDAGAAGEAALKDDEMGEECSGEEMEDEESPSKKRKISHGGVIDPKLEEPSDDEDEGQRPASNPVGAVLVSCY